MEVVITFIAAFVIGWIGGEIRARTIALRFAKQMRSELESIHEILTAGKGKNNDNMQGGNDGA